MVMIKDACKYLYCSGQFPTHVYQIRLLVEIQNGKIWIYLSEFMTVRFIMHLREAFVKNRRNETGCQQRVYLVTKSFVTANVHIAKRGK